jgi:hypothetical protein
LCHRRTRIGNQFREWKGKEKLDDATRCDFMRRKLCFTFKYPWVPDHRCMGKGQIHDNEVATDNDEEEQGGQAHDSESTSSEEEPFHEDHPPRIPLTPGGENHW